MLFEMKLLIVPDRISFRLLYARSFSRTFRTLQNALKHHLQQCMLNHLDFRAHPRIVRLRHKKNDITSTLRSKTNSYAKFKGKFDARFPLSTSQQEVPSRSSLFNHYSRSTVIVTVLF